MRSATPAYLIAGALVLAGCGGTEPVSTSEPSETGTAEPIAAEDDGPCPGRPAEEVLAELSQLPYEERLAVMEEKAAEEGLVTLYSAGNTETAEDLAKAFSKKYPGVDYSYVRARSENLPERLRIEAAAGRHMVDVIDINAVNGAIAESLGLVTPHHGATVPEGYPEQYVGDWSVTKSIIPFVIAWNTDLVPEGEAPQSHDDLLDPKWRGKVAVQSTPDAYVMGMIIDRGEEGAREYLSSLVGDQEAIQRASHSTLYELLAAGEFPISSENSVYNIERYMAEGAPLAWVAPEPTAANMVGVSVVACAPHPYAAALLAHYMVSQEGAQIEADRGAIAVNPDTELLYPGLGVFREPGTDAYERLLLLTPELVTEHNDATFALMEEIFDPNAE